MDGCGGEERGVEVMLTLTKAMEMMDEGDTPASQMWELPCQDFEGYWESYVSYYNTFIRIIFQHIYYLIIYIL